MLPRTIQDESIAARETRWRGIVEAAVDSIVTTDEQGVIDWCNAATERLFGYRSEDLIGQNVSLLMPEPYAQEHAAYMARYLETGERHIVGIGREVLARHRDGTLFPVDLAVHEFMVADRRLFAGVMRDLTQRKAAEQRALQAERLAAIGQMVTGLAHESRNALQRIESCAELLELELAADSSAQALVKRIQSAQEGIRRLFDEVGDYAKPLHVEAVTCHLPEMWREAWTLLSPQRQQRLIQLRESLPTGAILCRADPFWLVRVFRNLLENSLAACRDPIEIQIEVHAAQHQSLATWEIHYRDNGPGMTAQQRERVFEPFFTTKNKGTGLGMPIAQRILEAHGGHITVAAPPQGAEFIIVVPQHLTAPDIQA